MAHNASIGMPNWPLLPVIHTNFYNMPLCLSNMGAFSYFFTLYGMKTLSHHHFHENSNHDMIFQATFCSLKILQFHDTEK